MDLIKMYCTYWATWHGQRNVQNFGRPALKDLECLLSWVKAPIYWNWEKGGGGRGSVPPDLRVQETQLDILDSSLRSLRIHSTINSENRNQWFSQESGERVTHLHFLKRLKSFRQKAISYVERRTYFYVWKSGISMVKIDPSRDTSKVYRAYNFHEFVNTSLAMNILNVRLVLLDKLIQG